MILYGVLIGLLAGTLAHRLRGRVRFRGSDLAEVESHSLTVEEIAEIFGLRGRA